MWPALEMARNLRKKGIYVAHGAYNMNSPVHIRAAIEVAEELNAPLIAQSSEGANGWYSGRSDFRNATLDEKRKGAEKIAADVRALAQDCTVPVVLHLDHGVDPDFVISAIDMGYPSVMFDGSALSLEENIRTTKKIVEYAHHKGVSVEGEIGGLAGEEDDVSRKEASYTKSDEALRYVKETGVDALAISYGTSHGEFKGNVQLNLDIPRQVYSGILERNYNCELVSHGSSSLPHSLLAGLYKQIEAAGYGERFTHPTTGVPVEKLQEAIHYGISKINVDADIRLAITMYVWEYFNTHKQAKVDPIAGKVWELMCKEPSKSRPRYYMVPIQQQMLSDDRKNPWVAGLLECIQKGITLVLRERIRQLGTNGRAKEVRTVDCATLAQEYT